MDLDKHLPEGCSIAPKNQSDFYDWEAVITGPVSKFSLFLPKLQKKGWVTI